MSSVLFFIAMSIAFDLAKQDIREVMGGVMAIVLIFFIMDVWELFKN